MHFWVSATRGGLQAGFCWPRKIGTNWFMPALVKSRFGESGRSEDDGTIVCCFSRKKSRKDLRISAEVIAAWHGFPPHVSSARCRCHIVISTARFLSGRLRGSPADLAPLHQKSSRFNDAMKRGIVARTQPKR